jgi:A/G-specific adenine glycosylase
MLQSTLPPSPATTLINWQREHGRHDLPWQQAITPYRVWVSEIMLQQTQVGTVIGYFERFMARFPDLAALAAAPQDDVLHLWSGLGYYSRARNLHKAAQLAQAEYNGALPEDIDELQKLPGIGRSTAGAILSLACGQSQPILDGNVKRVLSRYLALPGWPGSTPNMKALWSAAEHYAPDVDADVYTQALMDLGATLCTRASPACLVCPISHSCQARLTAQTDEIPAAKPKRARPLRSTCFVIARLADGRVLLEKRPAQGIWGGLWCFPEAESEEQVRHWGHTRFGLNEMRLESLEPVRHGFTHFELLIHPHIVNVPTELLAITDIDACQWCNVSAPPNVGLAAPVARLLKQLAGNRQ